MLRLRRGFVSFLTFAVLVYSSFGALSENTTEAKAMSNIFNIGIGKADVTGPVAEQTMMGYADTLQRAKGLLNRLYVRAYVIEDVDNNIIALAHCDIHSIPLALHEAVIEKLEKRVPGVYNSDTVTLHAQHTHSGPGGLHSFYLYYLSVLGFTPLHFEMVANGIVEAIVDAHNLRLPRRLELSSINIPNCSKQRSMDAYLANPQEERDLYDDAKNNRMTVVRVIEADDPTKISAVWTFFAVHTTSLAGVNNMISSDNKGYAEWLLESKYPNTSFAFFQIDAGDVSPNVVDMKDGTFAGPHGQDFVRSAEAIGRCQADAAEVVLFETKHRPWVTLNSSVFARKVAFDFPKYKTQSDGLTLCPAVTGLHMLAGTEDGRGVPLVYEGFLRSSPGGTFARLFSGALIGRIHIPEEVQECHKPKIAAMATGLTDPPATPPVLPIQVVAIGNFVLAVLPFEVTTMSGRRIRNTVSNAFHQRSGTPRSLDLHIEVLAVSNAYSGYLATAEEYDTQHYEGASTHFGRNQLRAVQDMLTRVILEDQPHQLGSPVFVAQGRPAPLDVATQLLEKDPLLPPSVELGMVLSDILPGSAFARGEVAQASFWCARPLNSQLLVGSFCDIQRKVQQNDGGNKWLVIAKDHDWPVRFYWRRKWLLFSVCTCQWVIPQDQEVGTYRILHRGMIEQAGKHHVYESSSHPFNTSENRVNSDTLAVSRNYRYGIPDELWTCLLCVMLFITFTTRMCRSKPFVKLSTLFQKRKQT
mmetsp:Transcript_13805/g.26801  ORF Transcript_13805/g.26801 Transcript_13805/m.26801 type:complete len:754 (+) Transcript_13805:207-2468(+)